MGSTVHNEGDIYEMNAAGTEKPGDVIFKNGKAWIAQFDKEPAAGDRIAYRKNLVIEIEKASGLVLTDGVAVDYANSTKTAVATTTGDFALGKTRGAFGAGTLTCLVGLND